MVTAGVVPSPALDVGEQRARIERSHKIKRLGIKRLGPCVWFEPD
jgi:hypothetical protein